MINNKLNQIFCKYRPLVVDQTLGLVFQEVHGFLPAAKVEESLAHRVSGLLLLPPRHPEASEGRDTGASSDHDDWPDWILGEDQPRSLGQLDAARHLGADLGRGQHSRGQTSLLSAVLGGVANHAHDEAEGVEPGEGESWNLRLGQIFASRNKCRVGLYLCPKSPFLN